MLGVGAAATGRIEVGGPARRSLVPGVVQQGVQRGRSHSCAHEKGKQEDGLEAPAESGFHGPEHSPEGARLSTEGHWRGRFVPGGHRTLGRRGLAMRKDRSCRPGQLIRRAAQLETLDSAT
jgi:hypothetical protein